MAGIIVLAAGYFLLDLYLVRRAAERWVAVSRVAFKRLGRTADELHLGMQHLLRGHSPIPEVQLFDDSMAARIQDVVSKYDVQLAKFSPENQDQRLQVLGRIPDWCTIAIAALDFLKHQHRKSVAEWASVMLASDDLSPVLNIIAELNEKVFVLQDKLRVLLEPYYDAQAGHALVPKRSNSASSSLDDVLAAMISSWREVVEDAVFIQEELMQATGLRGWEHARGRAELGSWAQDFSTRHGPGSAVQIRRRRVQRRVRQLRRSIS